MLIATVVGIFIVPGLYAWTERWSFGKKKAPEKAQAPAPAPAGAAKASTGH
jgi:hypothetical protein